MKYKRILTFVVIVSLMTIGCSPTEKNQNEEIISKSPPTVISVAFWEIAEAFANGENDRILKKIQDDLNIKLVPVNISVSNWSQELQRYASSGEFPDIAFHDIFGTYTYESWIKNNTIRAIPTDLSNYPLIEEYINQDCNKYFRRSDGNMYMIPRITYSSEDMWALDRSIVVRKDWMERLNIDDPTNFSEFKQMLKEFVTKDPDNNGKNDTMGFNAVNMNLLEAIYLGIFPEMSNIERGWIKEDDKWMPVYNSKKVGDALACVKELYDEGLLDPNFAYQRDNRAREDFINGKVSTVATQFQSLAEEWNNKYPNKPITDVAKILPMWKAPDGNKYRFTTTLYWSESYFSSKVDDEKMDKILQLYNYLLSDDASMLLYFGVEGVDFKRTDGQPTALHNTGQIKDLRDVYPSLDVFRELVSWNNQQCYNNSINSYSCYGEEAVKYGIEQLDWFKKNTQRVNYNYDITFMSTPAKNLLPSHKIIHDEMLKIIVGNENAKAAWDSAINKIRNETTLNLAIEEVTNKANELGIE